MLQFSAVLNSVFTVSQRSHIFYCYSNMFGVGQHYFVFIKNPTLSIPVHEGGEVLKFFPACTGAQLREECWYLKSDSHKLY